MQKKKILFITTCLQKAGAEKYLFELITNIDKSKFHCEVLTVPEVKYDKIFPHYYYFKLLDLNIKIYRFLSFPYLYYNTLKLTLYTKIIYKLTSCTNRILYFLFKNTHKKRVENLLKKQDWIIVIDILNYHGIIKSILDTKDNFDIHLMCHKAQFKYDIYNALDNKKEYNFTCIDKLQIKEVLESGKKIKNHIYFPLSLAIPEEPLATKKIPEGQAIILKIGIFTRVSSIKPIDGCLLAFKDILYSNFKAELHVFGFIQDKEYYESLLQLAEKIQIENCIYYHGHVDNMQTAILENCIDVVWMLSINSFVGYASVEIGSYGFPLLFLNLEQNNSNKFSDTDVIKHFSNPKELAHATTSIIKSENREFISEDTRTYFAEYHNITKNINKYEEYLLNII